MPSELLIAIVTFVAIPMGLLIAAALVARYFKTHPNPYLDHSNWGSQDRDPRRKP